MHARVEMLEGMNRGQLKRIEERKHQLLVRMKNRLIDMAFQKWKHIVLENLRRAKDQIYEFRVEHERVRLELKNESQMLAGMWRINSSKCFFVDRKS